MSQPWFWILMSFALVWKIDSFLGTKVCERKHPIHFPWIRDALCWQLQYFSLSQNSSRSKNWNNLSKIGPWHNSIKSDDLLLFDLLTLISWISLSMDEEKFMLGRSYGLSLSSNVIRSFSTASVRLPQAIPPLLLSHNFSPSGPSNNLHLCLVGVYRLGHGFGAEHVTTQGWFPLD